MHTLSWECGYLYLHTLPVGDVGDPALCEAMLLPTFLVREHPMRSHTHTEGVGPYLLHALCTISALARMQATHSVPQGGCSVRPRQRS